MKKAIMVALALTLALAPALTFAKGKHHKKHVRKAKTEKVMKTTTSTPAPKK